MTTYTVIWRDGGDDFMLTTVNTAVEPSDMTSTDWVILAAEVEYADWDEVDRVAAIADLLDGFDLLDVLIGAPQSALFG
jgi:hypothetical protein